MQAAHQHEVLDLQSRLKVLSQRHHAMLNQGQGMEQHGLPAQTSIAEAVLQVASPTRKRSLGRVDNSTFDLKRSPPSLCKATTPWTAEHDISTPRQQLETSTRVEHDISTPRGARHETRADQTLSELPDGPPVSPSRQFTLIMTPASSQTCSSSPSSASPSSGHGASSPSAEHPQSTGSGGPESPPKKRTAVIAEITRRRAPSISKPGRPLTSLSCAGPLEKGHPIDLTPPGKNECMVAPPVPVDTLAGTPRDHVRSSLPAKPTIDDKKSLASERSDSLSHKVVFKQEDSPTALEPDTIEILRAALMNDLDLNLSGDGCVPKPSRGAVSLPPAAVQGRNAGNSSDSNLPTPHGSPLLPTPQGSPLVRHAFETTPRGSSPRQPVRARRLSQIFNSMTDAGTSAQVPTAAAQDTQGPIASPSRPNSELKNQSRRLSWPARAVVLEVGRVRDSPVADDGATPTYGGVTAGFGMTPCEKGASKLQPVVPLSPAEPPKTMSETENEGGLGDGATLHGIASPLRRRWLGVPGSGSSASALTPKLSAQRL